MHEVRAGALNRRFKATVTHQADGWPSLPLEKGSGIASEAAGKAGVQFPEGSPLTPSVTDVIVAVPAGFTITSASGVHPAWSATISQDRRTVLFSDGRIHPGQAATFHVNVNVPTPPSTVTREWRVFTSDDGGESLQVSGPVQSGALSTKILVL